MESLNAFLIVAILAFAFLFAIWERNNVLNFLIKVFFLGVCVWGIFLLLVFNGYVVKHTRPATPATPIGRNN